MSKGVERARTNNKHETKTEKKLKIDIFGVGFQKRESGNYIIFNN